MSVAINLCLYVQQQQHPMQMSAGFASANAIPFRVSNFGYHSRPMASSYGNNLGLPVRSTGRESVYEETLNEEEDLSSSTQNDVAQSEATQQTEENYDNENNAHVDSEGTETADSGIAENDVENVDDEDTGEEEGEQQSQSPVAKSGYRRRRKRSKKVKPKVIIVKKIIPVSTTTYAYQGVIGR